MSNLTLAELHTAIQEELQLDPGLISEAERRRFLNECLGQIGNLEHLFTSTTLSPSSGVVTIPSDLVKILWVFWDYGNTGQCRLSPMTMPKYTYGEAEKPTSYIYKGSTIDLYPTPTGSADVTLYYSYRPAKLVDSDDVPDIPEGYDQLLIDFAVSRCHLKNQNASMAREYMGYYKERKETLRDELLIQYNSILRQVEDLVHGDTKTPKTPYDYL